VQRVAHHTGDTFDIRFMQMPAQDEIDKRLQRSLDIRAFFIMQPFKRMMNQRDVQRGIKVLH
jgi:hypothetical protein